MNDLQATMICAEAIGLRILGECQDFEVSKAIYVETFLDGPRYKYAPLLDGASAMELMEKFKLGIDYIAVMDKGDIPYWGWRVSVDENSHTDRDLKKAITFFVANIKGGK